MILVMKMTTMAKSTATVGSHLLLKVPWGLLSQESDSDDLTEDDVGDGTSMHHRIGIGSFLLCALSMLITHFYRTVEDDFIIRDSNDELEPDSDDEDDDDIQSNSDSRRLSDI